MQQVARFVVGHGTTFADAQHSKMGSLKNPCRPRTFYLSSLETIALNRLVFDSFFNRKSRFYVRVSGDRQTDK